MFGCYNENTICISNYISKNENFNKNGDLGVGTNFKEENLNNTPFAVTLRYEWWRRSIYFSYYIGAVQAPAHNFSSLNSISFKSKVVNRAVHIYKNQLSCDCDIHFTNRKNSAKSLRIRCPPTISQREWREMTDWLPTCQGPTGGCNSYPRQFFDISIQTRAYCCRFQITRYTDLLDTMATIRTHLLQLNDQTVFEM